MNIEKLSYQYMEELRPTAINIAKKIVGARDAEDCVQEAYVSVLSHVVKMNGDKRRIDTYLRAAVKNKSINWFKSMLTAKHSTDTGCLSLIDPSIPNVPHSPPADDHLMEKFSNSDLERVVLRSIEKHCFKNKNDAKVLKMRLIEDRTVADISEILNLPLPSLKVRVSKLMKKIRADVAEEMKC